MLMFEGNLENGGFNFFARKGAANARLTAAEQDLLQTKNEVERKLENYYIGFHLQQQQVRAYGRSIADLQKTLDSYQRQYMTGLKTWLDMLNIRRELTEQRLQRAVSENEWLRVALRIAALSGHLETMVSPPPATKIP